jgi:hypothetical protein
LAAGEDPDGARGWIIARLLTPDRGALVVGKGLAVLRETADSGARVLWRAEPEWSAHLGDCDAGWCEFAVGARKGWVRAERAVGRWETPDPLPRAGGERGQLVFLIVSGSVPSSGVAPSSRPLQLRRL